MTTKTNPKISCKMLCCIFAFVLPMTLMPMKALAQNVCSIGDTQYATIVAAIAAVPTGEAQHTVIRLLMDINTGGISVVNKKITFDLNGYTLNADGGAGMGLSVTSGGVVKLLDPQSGKFNVNSTNISTGTNVFAVSVADGGVAEVTDANVSGVTSPSAPVAANAVGSGSEITLYGIPMSMLNKKRCFNLIGMKN